MRRDDTKIQIKWKKKIIMWEQYISVDNARNYRYFFFIYFKNCTIWNRPIFFFTIKNQVLIDNNMIWKRLFKATNYISRTSKFFENSLKVVILCLKWERCWVQRRRWAPSSEIRLTVRFIAANIRLVKTSQIFSMIRRYFLIHTAT